MKLDSFCADVTCFAAVFPSPGTLYFRGKRILHAVLLDLLSGRGMAAATDVVLTGCSAGGLAVFLNADYVAEHLPTSARLVAVPDSGYFFTPPGGADAKGSFDVRATFRHCRCF